MFHHFETLKILKSSLVFNWLIISPAIDPQKASLTNQIMDGSGFVANFATLTSISSKKDKENNMLKMSDSSIQEGVFYPNQVLWCYTLVLYNINSVSKLSNIGNTKFSHFFSIIVDMMICVDILEPLSLLKLLWC